MDTFEQFLTETSASDQECVEAFADHIKDLARRFNRQTLLAVWDKVSNGHGEELIRQIIKNPTKSTSDLRKLVKK